MHTLYDYVSRVNGIQYGLAVLFIVGFIVFLEVLKPRPFRGLRSAIEEDVKAIRAEGMNKIGSAVRSTVMGPVYALCYLAAVPVLFIHGMGVVLSRMFMVTTSVGWSPVRAYFTGSKNRKKADNSKPAQKASE